MKIRCNYCKKNVELDDNTYKQFVWRKNKYYCCDCFKQMCQEKMNNPRCKTEVWKSALQDIDLLRLKAVKKLQDILYKDRFFMYLYDMYGVTTLPKIVFSRFDSINKGTYKGMKQGHPGIPYIDLLDMWQRKRHYLQKNAISMKKNNNGIEEPYKQILYDTAIIVSRYDSYCRWKQKCLVDEQESAIHHDIAYAATLNHLNRMRQIQRRRNGKG